MRLLIATDGASRGNPGEAAAAFVVADAQNRPLCEEAHYLGQTTNNVAEYTALLYALEACEELARRRDVAPEQLEITVQTDSELMVRQLNGQYKVRSAKLRPYFNRIQRQAKRFGSFSVSHVTRDENQHADGLANRILDHRED